MHEDELKQFLQDPRVQTALENGMEYLEMRWKNIYIGMDDVSYTDEDIARAIVIALATYSRSTSLEELARQAQELDLGY